MLHDPDRHEPLRALAWDEGVVRATIARIVADTEVRFSGERYWPPHPLDGEEGSVVTPLYHGAAGVVWALRHLEALGAARLSRRYAGELGPMLERNRVWLGSEARREQASFFMGDTPLLMMAFGHAQAEDVAAALENLIAGNIEHPSRELMWGAPGTMLAALFMHERTGEARWSELFRRSADALWRRLEYSERRRCWLWTQQLYGRRSRYLGAAHGFAGVALPLIRGRALLDPARWEAWQQRIVETVTSSAEHEGRRVNWPAQIDGAATPPLVQICHGAPGFVVCLAAMPGKAIDELLIAAGETIWAAGPLRKGSNLCHGTGGNGYAFLELHQRTGDRTWLDRARSFAMHGIAQTLADASRYGQMRYSLWTGDPGFAIYLADCLRGEPGFPTLEVFWTSPAGTGG